MSTPTVTWSEDGQTRSARWRVDNGTPPPNDIQVLRESLTASKALQLARAGTALLWRGDYEQGKQQLQAMTRQLNKTLSRPSGPAPATALDAFEQHRAQQAHRARWLGQLLIGIDGDHCIDLRRAPQVQAACAEAWGPSDGQPSVLPLRGLLGLIGAHEWRKKGVPIPALGGAHIHPHHGVFSPVRGEYVDLVAQAPLPAALRHTPVAFDLGVGTGVLSAVLARRGIARVIGTDLSERALACARDNLQRLRVQQQVQLQHVDLYPEGQAALVVCNPPWVPATPSSVLEQAVYDADSAMLRGFLNGLAAHLCADGEGWLILSDLAEHLGLRPREQLLQWIDAAGLRVLGRIDTRPRHAKVQDTTDPLHAARSAEVTSLWRLGRSA